TRAPLRPSGGEAKESVVGWSQTWATNPLSKTVEMPEEDPRRRYAANLQGEVDSASLYRTLSQTEKNPELAQVYARLGAVEEAHAEFWKRKIGAIGQRVPSLRPSFRTRALAWLARRFGPAFVLPIINTLEQMDSGTYDKQPEAVAG